MSKKKIIQLKFKIPTKKTTKGNSTYISLLPYASWTKQLAKLKGAKRTK